MTDAEFVTPAGHRFVLRGDRTVWWPDRRALLVADLHWGREATSHLWGVPVPSGLLAAELTRLEQAVRRVDAAAVYVLGDLVHAAVGVTETVRDTVAAFRARCPVPMAVVRGNHDRHVDAFDPRWQLDDLGERHDVDGVALVHDPADAPVDAAWWMAGHLHPTARVRVGRTAVRVPAFAATDRGLHVPAFTDVARGVVMRPDDTIGLWAVTDGVVIPLHGPPV